MTGPVVPFRIEHRRREQHPPGRRLAAFIVAGAEVARASVDPDLDGVRLLGTVRSAALLAAAVTDARQDRQPRGGQQ